MARCLLTPATLALCVALVACSGVRPSPNAQTGQAPTAALSLTKTPAGPSPSAAAGNGTPASATAPASLPRSPAAGATPTSVVAPALALAAELPWQPVYSGDPLRLLVRLSSPRAMQEAYRSILAQEEGQTPAAPNFSAPPVPADWQQGLELTLYRVEAGGARQAVLTGAAWAPHLRQTGADLPAAGLLTWSREWLVPAEVAPLEEGEYLLAASWDGQGLDRSLLGPDGTVTAEEVRFAVSTPANDGERAIQAGRLAHCAYARGDYAEAQARGQEALDMGVEDGGPERFDIYFLVAGAAFGLKDYPAAIATYERVIALLPEGNDLAVAAQGWIDIIEKIQGGR